MLREALLPGSRCPIAGGQAAKARKLGLVRFEAGVDLPSHVSGGFPDSSDSWRAGPSRRAGAAREQPVDHRFLLSLAPRAAAPAAPTNTLIRGFDP